MIIDLLSLVLVGSLTHYILLLAMKDKPLVFDGCSVYRYPKWMTTFCILVATALIAMLESVGACGRHPISQVSSATTDATIALLGVFGAHYSARYRVVVNAVRLRVGAFQLKAIDLHDVVRIVYYRDTRAGKLHLYGRTGTKVSIWDSIDDFRELLGELKWRLPTGLQLERRGLA